MADRKRAWWRTARFGLTGSTLLMLALAAFSTWAVRYLEAPPGNGRLPEAIASESRDLYMLQTGPDGQAHSSLEATLLRRSPDGHAVLDTPLLNLVDMDIPWRARARRALVQRGNQEVRLEGEVLLTAETRQPLRISTEWLLVKPRLQHAETAAPVVIRHADILHRAHGGLHAALRQQRVALYGGIHSVFHNPTLPE